jgi:hypothetical protein
MSTLFSDNKDENIMSSVLDKEFTLRDPQRETTNYLFFLPLFTD